MSKLKFKGVYYFNFEKETKIWLDPERLPYRGRVDGYPTENAKR